MCVITVVSAILSNSTAVLADAMDFIGDAFSYAVSFYVLSKPQIVRSVFSIFKAATLISFGVPVLIYSMMRISDSSAPDYLVMNAAGMMGIISHIVCIYFLYQYRQGDSNQTSVWICTINDLIGNILTVIASIAVMYTDSVIPDIIAAVIIVGLALYGAFIILRQAIKEIREYKRDNKKIFDKKSTSS
ncbi:MAG: cation transporter [Candidatus Jidaibacter sp.]|jgi:Co/Zn/Cd efflux system component|nr:cation transporter [Candidatus Jidaibacter sp.]